MSEAAPHPSAPPDPLARVLEAGLAAFVVLAPLPFGAVPPAGRLALEVYALLLLAVWTVRAATRPAHLPPRFVRAGIAGLLALAFAQALPLGDGIVRGISPRSVAIRSDVRAAGEDLAAERDLLGADPLSLDRAAAISVDPGATASALRTGSALAALLLVAATVAATRGVRALAAALAVSAAFQGLYGTLVLASGHDRIWNVPKLHYLESATGTFVNRNHFAGFLAMALPCGLALALSMGRRLREGAPGRRRLAVLLGGEGSRVLFVALLVAVGGAGLLLSLSRAGITLGVLALAATAVGAGGRRLRAPLVACAIVLAVAAVPLAQIRFDDLAGRYSAAASDLTARGGRATVWADTLSMAAAFPVAGVGFGSFGSAYPLFRSPVVRLRWEHAHSDALQALAEGGVLGAVFLALILVPLGGRLAQGVAGRGGTVAVGLSAGLLAILLHAIVDFNFHIPSNAAVAAILAGSTLGLPWNERT